MQERTERKLIVFVNAPNDDRSATADGLSGQYIEHSDWANMPHAGLLSIASYLASRTDYEPVYFDGTINHPDELLRFVWQNAHDIQAIGFSMLSANAQTTCSLIRACKSIAPHIVAVIGNDHASFFATSIAASQAELVDAIFIGDSPYGPLAAFLKAAECGRVVDTKSKTDVQIFESARAAEFPPYQFDLIDRHFPHMAAYRSNFRNGVAAAVFDRLGIHVNSAVPIHIAQGCLKFVAKDPCSFCSIYPGKDGKAHIQDAHAAWARIHMAHNAGFDYLYVTADELSQTFPQFLSTMAAARPKSSEGLFENGQALLVGYARADGLANRRVVRTLQNIGFRLLMVGFDAFDGAALTAFGKGMTWEDGRQLARQRSALANCRDANLSVKAGIVVGYFGATEADIEFQVAAASRIFDEFADVIFSADVEILCPEPGSRDYLRLTNRQTALLDASRLGSDRLSDYLLRAPPVRGSSYEGRTSAISRYAAELMIGVSVEHLIDARQRIRGAAKRANIYVAG